MTVFIGVDGAVQQGLSTIGILLILILFTSCFPAYAFILLFSAWLVDAFTANPGLPQAGLQMEAAKQLVELRDLQPPRTASERVLLERPTGREPLPLLALLRLHLDLHTHGDREVLAEVSIDTQR